MEVQGTATEASLYCEPGASVVQDGYPPMGPAHRTCSMKPRWAVVYRDEDGEEVARNTFLFRRSAVAYREYIQPIIA